MHSPFRIENCTSKPLEFAVHLFTAPTLQDSLPARHGGTSTSKVPSSGPLMPGLQCYLPASAIWYVFLAGEASVPLKSLLSLPNLQQLHGIYSGLQ